MNLNPWKTNTHDRKLLEHGVHARARLVEFKPTTATSGVGGELVVCKVKLEFETSAGGTVLVQGKLPVYRWELGDWPLGSTVDIRYDPDDPNKWTYSEAETDAATGAPSLTDASDTGTTFSGVQVVNASGADPKDLMGKLASVRDQGLINEAQFDAAIRQVEGGSDTPPTGGPSIDDRLQTLDDLRARQLISDEEYAAERKRLLDSI